MKKTLLFITLLIAGLSFESHAQSSPNIVISIDTLIFKEYAGKYKFKDAPFEFVNLTTAQGRLYGDAGDAGKAELSLTETKDEFEIRLFEGTCKFIRDERGIIVKAVLSVQGNTFEGEKVE
jgi:hypothetical protein